MGIRFIEKIRDDTYCKNLAINLMWQIIDEGSEEGTRYGHMCGLSDKN